MRFPIVIHKDRNSGYGVIVPDLPGCFSAGDTLDDAIDSAHEAIACHLEGLLMDGERFPSKRCWKLTGPTRNTGVEPGHWCRLTSRSCRAKPNE